MGAWPSMQNFWRGALHLFCQFQHADCPHKAVVSGIPNIMPPHPTPSPPTALAERETALQPCAIDPCKIAIVTRRPTIPSPRKTGRGTRSGASQLRSSSPHRSPPFHGREGDGISPRFGHELHGFSRMDSVAWAKSESVSISEILVKRLLPCFPCLKSGFTCMILGFTCLFFKITCMLREK